MKPKTNLEEVRRTRTKEAKECDGEEGDSCSLISFVFHGPDRVELIRQHPPAMEACVP
jgi:hypothetical protein